MIPVDSKSTKNICFVSGKIVSEIRHGISEEYDADQADFMIENQVTNFKGKIIIEKVLCRILGLKATQIKDLPVGTHIILDGRVKYSSFRGFIQAWEAEWFK